MNKAITDALNDQIAAELYSAYLYLSMSTYCESINLPGCAHWLRVQAEEEVGHAMKIREFVEDRGGRVILQAIDRPPADFKSPSHLFAQVLEHEQKVSARINGLYALAIKEQDYPSQVMLQWFISEQVEEEKNASAVLERVKMAGDSPGALLMLDRELGSRKAD